MSFYALDKKNYKYKQKSLFSFFYIFIFFFTIKNNINTYETKKLI